VTIGQTGGVPPTNAGFGEAEERTTDSANKWQGIVDDSRDLDTVERWPKMSLRMDFDQLMNTVRNAPKPSLNTSID
jgi:hypothetical protein